MIDPYNGILETNLRLRPLSGTDFPCIRLPGVSKRMNDCRGSKEPRKRRNNNEENNSSSVNYVVIVGRCMFHSSDGGGEQPKARVRSRLPSLFVTFRTAWHGVENECRLI